MSAPPLSVRLPQPLRHQLTAAARADRRSVSALARLLIADGLALRERQAAAEKLRGLGFTIMEGR